ncbi:MULTISPECIES: HDOD domain-containing protein [unclassified Vibrio]|uniref:HDOD domain-containing protein n=1 Tax=Vibrio sp. HB236076 TaxID=3232307 RepID=A0AB39H6W1_9VIBR|nr:HDOD domain-containing protein [Vibrio sp. HB161653]MDP5253592.1 HDOD domain-containing protein [Vibrio sp. HB161653]
MEHLSFYWRPDNKQWILESLKQEFAEMIDLAIAAGHVSLPPLPDVVLQIQQLCLEPEVDVDQIRILLMSEPSLAASLIRIANSVMFNRRGIECHDLRVAINRLGILRVRDIITAQAIEQLKTSSRFEPCCQQTLEQSAKASKQLGATMALVVEQYQASDKARFHYFNKEKAFLTGLLADIGLYSLVREYHVYLARGNYLAVELAMALFEHRCGNFSQNVLSCWGFDQDYLDVASNEGQQLDTNHVSYLDIARIAYYLLLFRRQDDSGLEDYQVEFDTTGAQILYQLSNLNEREFEQRLDAVLKSSGL